MSLTADAHDLQPAHGRWRFWIAAGRDEGVGVRSSSEVIPFRRGRLHQPALGDRRSLELRGYIKELTDSAMQAELDLIKATLDPERTDPVRLTDTFADGSIRWIDAIPGDIVSRYAGEAGRLLSVELDALDPYWYRTWGNWTADSGLYADDGLYADEGSTLAIYPTSDPFDVTVQVLGTTDVTKVLAEIDGPAPSDVGVWNVSVDPEIGFSYPAAILGSNVVPNPSFETMPPIPSGTSQYGLTAATWEVDGATGTRSLEIAVTGPAGIGGYGLPEMPLLGPRLVRIRAWVRNPGTGSPTARLHLLARRSGTPVGGYDYAYGSWAYDPPDGGAWSGPVFPSIDVVQLLDPDVVAGFVRLDIDANPGVGESFISRLRWDDIEVRDDWRLLNERTLSVDSGARTARLETTNARGHLALLEGNRHGEYLRLRPGLNTIRVVGLPQQVRLTFPATYL